MPVVTMIGGGQLARMTHQAAIALGQTLRVLAGSADEPAAQVSPNVVLGSHDDLDALRRARPVRTHSRSTTRVFRPNISRSCSAKASPCCRPRRP